MNLAITLACIAIGTLAVAILLTWVFQVRVERKLRGIDQ